jgi:hypothetical protein
VKSTAEVILGHLASLERHSASLLYDDVCDGACVLFPPHVHGDDELALLPSRLLFCLQQ